MPRLSSFPTCAALAAAAALAVPAAAFDRAAAVSAFPTEFGGRMEGLYLDSGKRVAMTFCMTVEAVDVAPDAAAMRQLGAQEWPAGAILFTGVNSYADGADMSTVRSAGAYDPESGEVVIVEIEGTQSSPTIFTEGAWVGRVSDRFQALEAQWVPDWDGYRSWLTLQPGCRAQVSALPPAGR